MSLETSRRMHPRQRIETMGGPVSSWMEDYPLASFRDALKSLIGWWLLY